MVTNVSEKDKALQEVIAWCDSSFDKARQDFNASSGEHAARCMVTMLAYQGVIDHCQSMLGSGSMPSCLNYEDIDDSSPSEQPQVGDYGVAVRDDADGQEEIPFHIELEERSGLPVALLNPRLYAKPEDDIDDGQYVSLFQLYLDGFVLSRTGRKASQDQSEDAED